MTSDQVFSVCRIIEGALGSDRDKVLAYAKQLTEQLEAGGDKESAKRIQRLLTNGKVKKVAVARAAPAQVNGAGLSRLPVDSESRMPVADEEHHAPGTVPLVLSDETKQNVKRFLDYFHAADQLIASGVGISPSMLIYGPPGTGKTQLARFIAAELGMPLIVSRSDGLISSYLGSTAKNLRMLFEHTASRPCVLFLDEFDALAKMRDDSRELGELKRVVISLLQNIDAIGRDHVLLAATNHDHLLDPAIWRRFTYKVKLGLPGFGARQELLVMFFGRFGTPDLIEVLAHISEGQNGAQLRDISENCIRDAVLSGSEKVDAASAIGAMLSLGDQSYREMSVEETLKAIDEKTNKGIKQERLAALFGMKQPQVSKILRRKERQNGKRASSDQGSIP